MFHVKARIHSRTWLLPTQKPTHLEENNYMALITEHLHLNRNTMCIVEGILYVAITLFLTGMEFIVFFP